MDNDRCSECKSTDIHQGGEYAKSLEENGKIQEPNIQPNECRSCGHKWPHDIE